MVLRGGQQDSLTCERKLPYQDPVDIVDADVDVEDDEDDDDDDDDDPSNYTV